MKKVELRIIGLSYSQTQVGSYVLVLGKKKGNTRLPIIIKPLDAQYISMKIEDIKTSRPLTQDLIRSITDSLGADLQQVREQFVGHNNVMQNLSALLGAEDRVFESHLGIIK